MAAYEQSNFEEIATAIGVEIGQIMKHENLFEGAARWYRLDKKRPKRTAPSVLRRKLNQISKSAHRMLKSLAVNNPNDAADGPGDPEILNALVLMGEPNEDPIIKATGRIGRFVEIIDGLAAAAEFEHRAKQAATEVSKVGKLTVQEGNPGDAAVNDWIAAMMDLYRTITGSEPRTSEHMISRDRETLVQPGRRTNRAGTRIASRANLTASSCPPAAETFCCFQPLRITDFRLTVSHHDGVACTG